MPGDRFEARVSTWRTLLIVMLALAFVAVGWLILRSSDDALGQGIGWMTIVTFGGFAAIGAATLAHRGPVLTIDRQGFRWRRWRAAPIPWGAVADMAVTRAGGQSFVSLWLHDPAAYRGTTFVAWLARGNRALGHGDIALGTAGTGRRFAELLAAIDRFALQSLPNTAS